MNLLRISNTYLLILLIACNANREKFLYLHPVTPWLPGPRKTTSMNVRNLLCSVRVFKEERRGGTWKTPREPSNDLNTIFLIARSVGWKKGYVIDVSKLERTSNSFIFRLHCEPKCILCCCLCVCLEVSLLLSPSQRRAMLANLQEKPLLFLNIPIESCTFIGLEMRGLMGTLWWYFVCGKIGMI